jgi:hypothetical protein
MLNLRTYGALKLFPTMRLNYLTSASNRFSNLHQARHGGARPGVGGGRTTPYLSGVASKLRELTICSDGSRPQEKVSSLDFVLADASDLSVFEDVSFDAIVLPSTVDYWFLMRTEYSARECCRAMRDGEFSYSSHNSCNFVRPG